MHTLIGQAKAARNRAARVKRQLAISSSARPRQYYRQRGCLTATDPTIRQIAPRRAIKRLFHFVPYALGGPSATDQRARKLEQRSDFGAKILISAPAQSDIATICGEWQLTVIGLDASWQRLRGLFP
jgi:hypothetical protein